MLRQFFRENDQTCRRSRQISRHCHRHDATHRKIYEKHLSDWKNRENHIFKTFKVGILEAIFFQENLLVLMCHTLWNTKKKSARSESFSRLRFIQRVLDFSLAFFFCCGGPSRSAKVASKSASAAATLPAYWESRASHSSAAAAYTAATRCLPCQAAQPMGTRYSLSTYRLELRRKSQLLQLVWS